MLVKLYENQDHLSFTLKNIKRKKKNVLQLIFPHHYTCIYYIFFRRAYLRDVIEMVHIFFKLMENFCKGGVVVQKKSTKKAKHSKKSSKNKAATSKPEENLVSTILNNHNNME